MQGTPSRRAWLIPGLIAVILFVGGVANNLIASDLEKTLKPYRLWVWLIFALALVVAVITAIVEARRKDHPTSSMEIEESRVVKASSERSISIAGKAENSLVVTGHKNVFGNNFEGDRNFRDKLISNTPHMASDVISALHQLRPPVGDFIGREKEIDTLIKALRHGSKLSIIGINGMGGVGKTELALLVADRVSKDYPDAQLFINLQGTEDNPRPPEEVMGICIRAFRGPEVKLPKELDQLAQLYRSELSGKRVLLLLDNVANSTQVLPLIPPVGSALLVTSRQSIALPGLATLKLNTLNAMEARELLLEIAPRSEPAADQICKLCGYLPLAIRAAGSLFAITPDLDPVDYVEQLNDERNRLEHIGKEAVEISVDASLNLSYQRLIPEAARVFRTLSVFPGTFDAAAEERICADEGHVVLSDLVRRSLVLFDESTKRYRLHDLARLFAAAKLNPAERHAGLKHHAAHYKDVLATADDLYLQGGDALTRGLALFDLEWSNIYAGQTWTALPDVDGDEDSAKLRMNYDRAGIFILELRQHARERIYWLEIALQAARRLKDRAHESSALGNLGNAYANLREFRRAIQLYEQALLIDRERGDRAGEGISLGNLGVAYRNLGKTKRAIQFHKQRWVISREIGDRRGEAMTLGNLGNAYADLGETHRAIQYYEQQLTIVRENRERRGESDALANLAVAYADQGHINRAIEFSEQALLIDRELGDRRGEGNTLWNLSVAMDQLGKRPKAIEHAQQALTILEQIEDPLATKVRAKLAAWKNESDRNN